MTEQTTDEKVEKLAKAIYKAHQAEFYRWDVPWDEWQEDLRERFRNQARAALRHLGCIDEDGKVFVPDVRAAVAALMRAKAQVVRVNASLPHDVPRFNVAEWAVDDALRALTGSSDG